jgi:hypothetical protein
MQRKRTADCKVDGSRQRLGLQEPTPSHAIPNEARNQ